MIKNKTLKLKLRSPYLKQRLRKLTTVTKTVEFNAKEAEVRLLKEKIFNVIKEIDNLNKEGFVKYKEFLNSGLYPNLTSVIFKYSRKNAINSVTDKELKNFVSWCYNILMLEKYYDLVSVDALLPDSDLKVDIHNLKKEVLSKINPSIRVELQDRGMSLIKNIYTGYDSEYKTIGLKENKLLSVQLAVNTKTILVLPFNKRYTLSDLNPLNSKGYESKVSRRNQIIGYTRIENDINSLIEKVRDTSYYKKDLSIKVLINGLIKEGISYIRKENNIYFSFDRTPIKTWFNKALDGYTLKELVKTSNNIASSYLEKEEVRIYNLLKNIFNSWKEVNNQNVKLIEDFKESSVDNIINITTLPINEVDDVTLGDDELGVGKKYSRTKNQSFVDGSISVTKKIKNYLIGHLTNADLSILTDFEEFKDQLDIVNGSFVTLRKPILINGSNVYVRDTMLLAPGSKKSLASIGEMYGEKFTKININRDWYEKMDEFMETEFEEFKEYAIRDALITLVHASYMDDFNFKQGMLGVPLTLSSLSASYLRNKWKYDGYGGYQLSEYLIGEPNELITPKSLNFSGFNSLNISMYIANYKGGRNESFMYGKDTDTVWYDYDLTSAYTTVMSLLGNPNYKRGRRLTLKELNKMSDLDILYSYTIIKAKFRFSNKVKYPSIPCFVDKGTTIYPLEGVGYLTGAEYILAKNQRCYINVEDIYHIPFYTDKDKDKGEKEKEYSDSNGNGNGVVSPQTYKPFKNCIDELQSQRRKYPKGTIDNLIYKDMGNSLYGLVTKGLSNKMKFDVKTRDTQRIKANDLSNPIMASWITSFTRSVIGELLHNVHSLGGKIVSVTTDGFITDINNLENLILTTNNLDKSSILLKEYRKIREILSDDPNALELKNSGKGILSWTTRGQFSYDARIIATTGLQRRYYTVDDLNVLLYDTFDSDTKLLTYIERSLRSATDIFKKGGSVTPTYKDRTFRMLYDNRRIIVSNKSSMYDSKPMKDVNQCDLNRFISKLPIKTDYHKNTSGVCLKSKYKSYLELAVRTFIRGLVSGNYNLDKNYFNNYKEIVLFIKDYKSNYNISENTISLLKRRPVNHRKIPINKEITEFVEYIKKTFPNFDVESFLK